MRANLLYERPASADDETGSIIIVVGTDAPLLPHQLKRIVKRAALGLARDGGIAGNGSGDVFIAFSTANDTAGQAGPVADVRMLANDNISPFFLATVEATEEAIINALVAGRDMTGDRGHTVRGIDTDELQRVMARYGRLNSADSGVN